HNSRRISDSRPRDRGGARCRPQSPHGRPRVRRETLAALLEGCAAGHRAHRPRRDAPGHRVLSPGGARRRDVRRRARHGVRPVVARQRLPCARAVRRHGARLGRVHRHRALARLVERSLVTLARGIPMKLKITDAVVHRLSVPLPRPVRTARHDYTHADTVAVELRTDAGLVGAGYCFAFGARRARALAELVEDLAELYVGKPPAPQTRHAEARRALNFIGHACASLIALAPLDTACWDLAARAANLPLFRFLGGDRTRVPTYASSGLWIDYSVDALLREAEAFRAAGHRAMKLRVGRTDPEEDIERVRILRGALGGDAALLADANQGWDEPTAIRIRRRLQEHDLYWLQAPLPYDDLPRS